MAVIRALFLLFAAVASAAAEPRIALVIGNASYTPPLRQAADGAAEVAEALLAAGFDVAAITDADYRVMRRAVADLARRAGEEGREATVLVYYAGRAASFAGRSYLIPIDAKIKNVDDLPSAAYSVDEFIRAAATSADSTVIVLNACAAWPAPEGAKPRIARIAPPRGATVALCDAPGALARDGDGGDIYAEALADAIRTPGLSVKAALSRVRQAVMESTGGRQKPWSASHSSRGLNLFGLLGGVVGKPTTVPKVDEEGASGETRTGAEIWDVVKDSGDPAMYAYFIRRFPDSPFAPLARGRIEELRRMGTAGNDSTPEAQTATTASPKPSRPAPATAKPAPPPPPPPPPPSAKPAPEPAETAQPGDPAPRPAFPWPPPQPSAVARLPIPEGLSTAGEISAWIETAMDQVGYHDRSWWTAPGGFVLATRLERIGRDGAPAQEDKRWPPEDLSEEFSLGAYLASLFYTEPGYFRVIAFILSDQFEQTGETEPSVAEAMAWTRRGMVALPKELAAAGLSPSHRLTALIYEFERPPDGEPAVLAPGRLTGRAHLQKARLAAALGGP